MKTRISTLAITGILGLGAALATVLPASAHEHGRLKADKTALHLDHKALRNADTRAERKAARSSAIADRATLDEQRILIKGQDHQLHVAKQKARLARLNSTSLPTARDVYHARFNH